MIDFEKGESDVQLSEYLYELDKEEGVIYQMHTEKTEGKSGSIFSVICVECKNDMLQEKESLDEEEYYCPVCHY